MPAPSVSFPQPTNFSSVDQVINAATAYVAGSAIGIPGGLVRPGTVLRWKLHLTKTAAGLTAGCAVLVKAGATGTTADATVLTFTFGTPTAAADNAVLELECIVRSVSATGVIEGEIRMLHNLAATGFSTLPMEALQATSAGFDMTVAGLSFGLVITTTAASVWTVTGVIAEITNS